MALGYCPAILEHMKYVIGENAPETKITPSGFLKVLLEKGAQASPMGDPLTLSNEAGHIKDLRLKYYTRTEGSQISEIDNCDINLVPEYSEITIDSVATAKFGMHFSDETIARYCDEASRSVVLGGAPTPFMQEHLAGLMASMNGFVTAINSGLTSSVVWGVNAVTGNNTAVTVNFNQDLTVDDFTEGWTKVLNDYAFNEGMGRPIVVGSGLVNAAAIQARNGLMTNYAQMNNNAGFGAFDYYHDIISASTWGANQFGVFQPGTFGLVQINKYTGFRAGQKGTSWFWNMPIPMDMPGAEGLLPLFNIDFQMKYLDCPTTVIVGEEEVTYQRGWSLIMSKEYALWQVPNDAYQATDRLTGVNGAFRYTATNA